MGKGRPTLRVSVPYYTTIRWIENKENEKSNFATECNKWRIWTERNRKKSALLKKIWIKLNWQVKRKEACRKIEKHVDEKNSANSIWKKFWTDEKRRSLQQLRMKTSTKERYNCKMKHYEAKWSCELNLTRSHRTRKLNQKKPGPQSITLIKGKRKSRSAGWKV